jgi:hypothetical protein
MSTKIVIKYVEFFTFFPQKRPKNAEFGDFGKKKIPIPLLPAL